MPKHYQPIIQQPLNDFFKFKAGEQLSPYVNESIQLTYPALSYLNLPKPSGMAESTATGTLSITLSKPFLLFGFIFHMVKDAACDAATGAKSITAILDGGSKAISRITVLTLTAQDILLPVFFPIPIRLDAGAVSQATTYAAGNMARSLVLYGVEL